MLKKDLEKPMWLTGSISIDHENLEVYFIDKKSNTNILLTDGMKLMFKGMSDGEYKNKDSIGYFRDSSETMDVTEVEKINYVYLKKSIEPNFKEFLANYIDSDILSFLEGELKKYEVTLYDCTTFKLYEDHTKVGFINGTNLIQFESEITFGYCFLIHKFRINKSLGLSIVNEFEFISETGDKQKYIKEIKLPVEEVLSEEEELERQFLEYYESKFNQQKD
ncbi:hypothetical protein [Neobacillus vireti]|uniref:hypothetical protein n=1 Tax=Neobacillus vireti TaxID=220686 RepID=UPI002FFF7BA0